MNGTISKLQQKQEYWQKHITAWQSSNLSQKTYCQSHGIALATFGYWKRKLKNLNDRQVAFYPLTVPATLPDNPVTASPASIAVHVNRFKLEIQSDFCAEQLKKVVKTLEQLT